MTNNRLSLINAINNFDGYDEESFILLRDILCDLSEKQIYENDLTIAQLLYVAARKMRAFGYNKMNGLDNLVLDNSLMLSTNEIIDEYYVSASGYQLDYEQKKVIDKYETSPRKRLFLSAPTAFGKTFILKEILLRHNYNTILLIFPTVSLLNENTNSLKEFIKNNDLDYEIINTTRSFGENLNRKILILTPERVLKLYLDCKDLRIDFFFMDEIYKVDNFFDTSDEDISEDNRDKVFRIVLYSLSLKVDNFYLAGPYINTSTMGYGFATYIKKHSVAVYEVNREMISKVFIPAWGKRLVVGVEKFDLPTKKLNRLKSILDIISCRNLGSTLIYMSSKAQIDTASHFLLKDSRKVHELRQTTQVFLNHLKKRYGYSDEGRDITAYWSLIGMLNVNLGIHHGSLPKYIQEEILGLFNSGELHTILSTTSITEGVNTTAKNVIFYGGSKGGKQLKVFDVKNINGRAGRYYHNFIGRIFFMEKSVRDIIDDRRDDSLDFITYSDKQLSGVDLDNTAVEDLTEKNARLKIERELEVDKSGIPGDVFKKNRLVDKLQQIELIKMLELQPSAFFTEKAVHYSSIANFLRNGELKKILDFLKTTSIVDEFDAKRFSAIANTYSKLGFSGMLSYEIKKEKERLNISNLPTDRYDTCYRQSFAKIRNIIEFSIPKILSIYSHLFSYVSNNKGIIFDEIKFEPIIAFYELGVYTPVGLFLAEKGFPVAAIKDLEKNISTIMSDIKQFEITTSNNTRLILKAGLDEYELKLLKKYLD